MYGEGIVALKGGDTVRGICVVGGNRVIGHQVPVVVVYQRS
jgi:hypothetical protein